MIGRLIAFIILSLLVFSRFAFASQCSNEGYSVVYVNGILTTQEEQARKDMKFLENQFEQKTNIKNVKFITGYNPSHIAGLGDVIETASQILDNPINNYDLNTILLQIYPEVATRKILLVGHSQGTFYTNEIYDYLVKNGESRDTVGVYNVATPASSVSGDGAYLTSENDKVINLVRAAASKAGAKQPLPANITIPPVSEDSLGHSFSGVYLANAAGPIISSVDSELKKLSVAEIPNTTDAGCFTPPPRDFSYNLQKTVFAIADPIATSVVTANKNVVSGGETALAQIVGPVLSFSQSFASTIQQALSSMFSGGGEKIVQTIDVNNNVHEFASTPLPSDNTAESDISGQSAETPKTVITTKSHTDETEKNVIKPQETKTTTDKEYNTDKDQKKVVKLSEENKKIEEAPTTISKSCSFVTSQSPSHSGVIISEVAWMGGPDSAGLTANDEWIELKNISNRNIDVSGWQLIDKGEQIKINLGFINETEIGSNQFILFERTNDNSVPNIPADLIYTGILSNSDEGLRLFDQNCNLIDEVLASPSWPAGNIDSKRTMEREANLNWHTYGGDSLIGIFGTPKHENGSALVVYTGGGGWSAPVNNQQQATTNSSQPAKILINEVQITGGIGKTENDFIELYNPNNFQVNLNGYHLVKRTKTGTSDTSIKSWTTDIYIPASGYYLWANRGYADVSAMSDISTVATISNDNGVAIRYGAEDTGTVIDSVAFGGAENIFIEGSVFTTNPGANQSLQRKFQNNTFVDTDNNANDFEIQTCPSPKTQSRSCQTADQTPGVLLPLSITEVIYDPDGSDEGRELVKINNPNSEEVNLGGYSLQYLGSDGDFTKIKKKNFEINNKVPIQGIFKIGTNCHSDAPCENVDLSWSESLNNEKGTVFLVSNQEPITGLSDQDIIDGFHYPDVTQLAEPNNLKADYDPNKLQVNFSWDSNPSLVYQVQEYNSPSVTIFEGKGSSFIKHIDKVGRNYKFSITAFNENAEHTGMIEKEITVPSFLKDVGFYKNPIHTNKFGDYLVYVNYRFNPSVTDLYGRPDSWKLLVFYLNSDAGDKKEELMPLSSGWEPVNKENVLRLKYQRCSDDWQESSSLILPDVSSRCHIQDGLSSRSLKFNLLEDPYFKIGAISSANSFSPNDYITIAYYSFYDSGGGEQIFKFVATDTTKYYFQDIAPVRNSPTEPSNIEVSSYTVNSPTSTVQLSMDSSVDSDSIDSAIKYEWSLDDVLWRPLSLTDRTANKLSAAISLELGGTYNISIRAIDDLGNLSGIAKTTIVLPPPQISLIPDPSNDYFAIDGAKLVGSVINIKWRLIKNPASDGTFGIIPFNPLIGISSRDISNFKALNRDYDSNFSYPYLTANSGQCNSNITPFSQYVLGWQYQTNFSSIGGTPATDLLGKEINFGLYIGTPCGPGGSPAFSGYPVVVN